MNSAPRLVFVGDVGGPRTYHVGDEAMLEANLEAFRTRCPNLIATIISRDPEWSASHYHADAIAAIGFPSAAQGNDEARRTLLDRLLMNLESGGRRDTCGRTAITAIAASNGVVVSGGGNLSATWPEHVYERVALAEIAHRLGKPIIFLGQTIGPDLSPEIEPLLASTLQRAKIVGVRELPSAALALSLGVSPQRLLYQRDDAFFLTPIPVENSWAMPLRRGGPPWIAVTIDPFAEGEEASVALDVLASQLSRLATYSQARLVFLPHVAAPNGDPTSDVAVGQALAARLSLTTPMFICDVLEARQACWLTGQADLIVSTRYHPLVFGLAAGVPSIGIVTDEYRRIKLYGALSHARMETCCLSLPQVLGDDLYETAAALWDRRHEIRRDLVATRETCLADEARRWRTIFSTLGLPDASRPLLHDETVAPIDAVLGTTASTLVWRLLDEFEARRRFSALERSRDNVRLHQAQAYIRSLEEQCVALRATTQESERYAKSLLVEHAMLKANCAESGNYARSLEEEQLKLRGLHQQVESYARSLEEALNVYRSAG